MKRRVFVIGLDGATFDLIQPFIERGLLPTFKKLMENGTYGVLKSSIPPVTVPAWKCYTTGRNPGKLGVATHRIVDRAKRKVYYVNSTSFHGPEIWDIIGQFDLKSIVVNMPLTYPPRKINGIMISGVGTPRSSSFCYPKEIMKELSENVGSYEPWKPLDEIFLTEEPLGELKRIIQSRFSAMEYLCKSKEWDFFHGTVFLSDVVQHFYWTDLDKLSEIWTIIDQGIGRLLRSIRSMDPANVFLISDHGFGKVKGIFYIDKWLIEERYLRTKGILQGLFRHIRTKIDSLVFSMIRFLCSFEFDLNNKILLSIFKKTLYLSERLFGRHSVSWDWKKSKVFALANGISAHIYINKNQVSLTSEFESLKKEIQARLTSDIDIPLTVFDKHEVYSGNHLEYCPDLIVMSKNQEYIIRDTANHAEAIFNRNQGKHLTWTGTHRMNGIFIAYGRDIKRNKLIQEANILDVTPTILHILGVPIPSDIDGKVLKTIFMPNSDLARREIKRVEIDLERRQKEPIYSEHEKRELEDRLRQLGYL